MKSDQFNFYKKFVKILTSVCQLLRKFVSKLKKGQSFFLVKNKASKYKLGKLYIICTTKLFEIAESDKIFLSVISYVRTSLLNPSFLFRTNIFVFFTSIK